MKLAPLPVNEPLRQAAVIDSGLMGDDINNVLQGVMQIASEIAGTPVAMLSVIDGEQQWLKASKGVDADMVIPRAVSFCGHTVFHDQWFEVPDTLADLRFAESPFVKGPAQVRFYAGMPVHGPGQLPIGALCVMDNKPRALTEEQRTALQNLAHMVEEHLALNRAVALDALTGVYNRRMLDRRYDEEWRRAKRGQQSIAVLLIDIDHFKAYNDSMGHPAGDTCIRHIAQTITAAARRPPDVVARYGGEEFMMVLPGTDTNGACLVAERLRQQVLAAAIPHQASGLDEKIITVSIGIAAVIPSAGAETASGLIQKADQALYAAKNAGRNRVVAMPA
jgi:diguanylate cyclase (GGDEF)-like protein